MILKYVALGRGRFELSRTTGWGRFHRAGVPGSLQAGIPPDCALTRALRASLSKPDAVQASARPHSPSVVIQVFDLPSPYLSLSCSLKKGL